MILQDLEHELGARITLEQNCHDAPFAITCGIYGWIFHTRYFGSKSEAVLELEKMKTDLTAILEIIPHKDDQDVTGKGRNVSDAIQSFVKKFP